MKKIIWDNPNKMHIETGHKGFDKACKCLFTGNAYSDTQSSSFIRAKTNTECNERSFPEGELRNFDLECTNFDRIPCNFRDKILEATDTEPAILYKIFHYKDGHQSVHGWILTKTDNELIGYYYGNYRMKTVMIMDEVVQYLSNPKQTKGVVA